MKESHRTRRMERHHKRNKKNATLHMVSMMDIFTILVFFLLVSAGNQQNLPDLKHIKLPDSQAQLPPKENLLILVNNQNILFEGKAIASTREVLNSRQFVIPGLLNALDEAARQLGQRSNVKTVKKRGVTIMGDKNIPYALLKRIMLTCADSHFTNISLAVVHKSPEKK